MFKGKKTWLTISLYVNSVAIGVILMWFFTSGGSSSGESDAEGDTAELAIDIDKLLAETNDDPLPLKYTIKNGDRKFERGEFDDAILNYQNAIDKKNRTEAVLYRIALALEATSRFKKTEEIYTSIQQTTTHPYFKRAATIGLARIYQKTGRQPESRVTLWKLFLDRPIDPSDRLPDPGFVGDASHLLAASYANKIVRPRTKITTDIDVAVHAETPFDPHFYLFDLIEALGDRDADLVNKNQTAEAKKSLIRDANQDLQNGQLTIRPVGEAFEKRGQQVFIQAKQVGLAEIFTTLQSVISTKIEFTERALAEVQFRSQTIHIKEIDFATLLHGLLAPLDLYWVESNGVFQIAAKSDFPAEKLKSLAYQRVVHLLRYTIFDFPENRMLPSTQFVYGNLSFQKQEWTTAIANYREALNSNELSSYVRQRAAFNLGKAYLHSNEIDSAEKALFVAVDESFGGDLSAAGLIVLARQHAIDGRYESGIKHSSHAVVAAATPNFKAEAAIMQSSIYLLSEKYFAANQAIMDNRTAFLIQQDIDLGTFLSAYARYFAQQTHGNEEPEDLLRMLDLAAKLESRLPHLPLLLAKARRGLGFHQEAIEGLINVFAKTNPSHLRQQMQRELSQELVEAGPLPQFVDLYEKLVASGTGRSTSSAQMLRNAVAEFENENYENCKRICEAILSQQSYPDLEKRTLQLIGEAYQRTGDYHTAATYFAGIYSRKPQQITQ